MLLPCYWLVTNNNIRRKHNTKHTTEETKHREKDSREKHRTSGLTRSSSLRRLYTESFRILHMLKFQKGFFLY
jgi:regulator of replication initiation timing